MVDHINFKGRRKYERGVFTWNGVGFNRQDYSTGFGFFYNGTIAITGVRSFPSRIFNCKVLYETRLDVIERKRGGGGRV